MCSSSAWSVAARRGSVVFAFMAVLPGDPARVALGVNASGRRWPLRRSSASTAAVVAVPRGGSAGSLRATSACPTSRGRDRPADRRPAPGHPRGSSSARWCVALVRPCRSGTCGRAAPRRRAGAVRRLPDRGRRSPPSSPASCSSPSSPCGWGGCPRTGGPRRPGPGVFLRSSSCRRCPSGWCRARCSPATCAARCSTCCARTTCAPRGPRACGRWRRCAARPAQRRGPRRHRARRCSWRRC